MKILLKKGGVGMDKKSKKKFLLAVEGSGSDHTLAIAKYVGQVRDFQESEIVSA